MADWLDTMREILLEDGLLAFVLFWLVGLPSVVLIHELGHAAAIRMRGLRLDVLSVGDREDVLIRLGRTVFHLGRPERADWSGFVTLDPDASPEDVIVIALAGPVANLLTAPLYAAVALWGTAHGDVELWILAVVSLVTGVANLIPIGTPDDVHGMSDGGFIRHAVAVRAGRALPLEWPTAGPAEPTEPVVADTDDGTFRTPFKVALGLLLLFFLVVGGLAGALAVAVPIAILLGVGYLLGWHRAKAF